MLLFYQVVDSYMLLHVREKRAVCLKLYCLLMRFGREVFKDFDISKTHPDLSRYMQSVDKGTKVCDLCPLKRHIVAPRIFEVSSNDV